MRVTCRNYKGGGVNLNGVFTIRFLKFHGEKKLEHTDEKLTSDKASEKGCFFHNFTYFIAEEARCNAGDRQETACYCSQIIQIRIKGSFFKSHRSAYL